MFHVIEKMVQCSKCKSFNIVTPVNDNKVWVYRCLDCGHTKDYKPLETISTTDMVWFKADDLNKPESF